MLKHKGTEEIRTDRLVLRKYRLSDVDDMFKNYANDERVTTYLSWKAYEKSEDILPFLEMAILDYEKISTYHWAIEYEGEMIGSISVMSVDDLRNNCEVGYCIGYDYWNKGITSEALAAVIQFLFEEVGMHRILAKHDVENPASGEVMKKCGMTYEGRFKEYYLRHDGTYSDALVYGIVNEKNRRQVKMRLDGFGLFVEDMAKMVRFYRDVLGFEIKEGEDTSNVYLVKDGTLFLLYGRKDFEKMTSRKYDYIKGLNGHMEIALYVDTYEEVDEEYAKAISKGAVSVLEPEMEPWGQRTCYIADPEGNLIEIGSFNKPFNR